MENARPQDAETSASRQGYCTPAKQFLGTDNPRHLRALQALRNRPTSRETLDKVAGCSNGPALIAELRSRGLEIPCKRIQFEDRDGKVCRPGVYYLTDKDRRMLSLWLGKRGGGV